MVGNPTAERIEHDYEDTITRHEYEYEHEYETRVRLRIAQLAQALVRRTNPR
jgi:hypothetical protein